MATRMQQRRDSAADWTSTDPTLAAGEIGVETDTGLFKIGDGSTAWTALAYFTHPDADHAASFAAVGAALTAGGTAGQILVKNNSTDYNTVWIDRQRIKTYPTSGSTLNLSVGSFNVHYIAEMTADCTVSLPGVVSAASTHYIIVDGHDADPYDLILPGPETVTIDPGVTQLAILAQTRDTGATWQYWRLGEAAELAGLNADQISTAGTTNQFVTAAQLTVINSLPTAALAPVQLRYDTGQTRWEDAAGTEYDNTARAALRPHPIYWLCEEGFEPAWGANDYDANTTYGDLVNVYATP